MKLKLNLNKARQAHLAAWPVVGLMAAMSVALTACGGGGGGGSSTATPSAAATQDVTVQFAAVVGSSAPVDCSSTLTGLGNGVNAQLKDLRFYLSNVRLVSSTGAEVPITLTTNNYQQGSGADSAVLIDLTGAGTGSRVPVTDVTADTNNQVVGKVPPGTYVGFRATVGLSDALNHADPMMAAAPLDLTAMGWSWQNGYKFIKLELDPTGRVSSGGGTVSTYNVHVASTNCTGPNGSATCTNANKVSIDIALNPASQQVALDLNEVFRGVNLSTNATGAVGCMSAVDDTDCATLFNNLGLNLNTGANVSSPGQQIFKAINK